MSEKTQVIVVGGGASGLAAAIAAAENGAAVTLLEQNENPGRKICVTGNGRCNLTNKDMRPEIFRGQHPEFAAEILAEIYIGRYACFFRKSGSCIYGPERMALSQKQSGEMYSGTLASESEISES